MITHAVWSGSRTLLTMEGTPDYHVVNLLTLTTHAFGLIFVSFFVDCVYKSNADFFRRFLGKKILTNRQVYTVDVQNLTFAYIDVS